MTEYCLFLTKKIPVMTKTI